ncbi:hypothetical protein [Asticcacaulis sp.]|uniref:hypothetical protein n=1 Tax=Asticcacaulis sp. TaxID=1872648 RepID=UPI0031DC5658
MSVPFRAAVTAIAAVCLLVSPAAQAASSKAGTFNSAASRKAWPHIQRAMTGDMAEMADKATELKPEYVLSYGLALEMGREPVRLSGLQKSRIQAVFQDFLNMYIRKSDNIKLDGREEALLGQPDFWIMVARELGRPQTVAMMRDIPLPGMDGMSGSGGAAFFTGGGGVDNPFSKEDYTLKGDKVLNRYMVYASQSCVIYARTAQRMKRVLAIPASEAPHLSPAAYKQNYDTALALYKDANRQGPQACGSRDFYTQVLTYADRNMGALERLKADPTLAAAAIGDNGSASDANKP